MPSCDPNMIDIHFTYHFILFPFVEPVNCCRSIILAAFPFCIHDTAVVLFFKVFFVGHIHMSYFGATGTPVLDFW